ncbi:TetR/AcrR family transcriptional regulator [Flavobacteriaceae bacterium MHTCC 0001]
MIKTAKHDAKANFLLEKGMEILWSKGYNATSVNDIVKAAEVPKGSFYFYFDSKEDFAVRAIDKYFSSMFTPARAILENTDKSPKTRLLEFHRFRISVLKDEMDCKMGCMACNLGSEMAEHSEKIREAIVSKERLVLSIITEVIRQAQEEGEISSLLKPEDLAAFIEDAGKGAMVSMKEKKSSYPIDNVMNMIEQVLLK